MANPLTFEDIKNAKVGTQFTFTIKDEIYLIEEIVKTDMERGTHTLATISFIGNDTTPIKAAYTFKALFSIVTNSAFSSTNYMFTTEEHHKAIRQAKLRKLINA